ncbi:MAG: PfkB family carbohydrate kinase [Propionibacteriaceae bacterium]|jgi:sugar/nucleoside kinase (ribokinase family)|nr:PfkB family carbohydrate kinase [Propionibacteriaceae bacterium]
MTQRIWYIGQAIVDLSVRLPHLPEVGGDVFAQRSQMSAGGGFNVLAAAARDGGAITYLGTIGDGPLAAIISGAMVKEGIAQLNRPIIGQDSGWCLAMVDDDAERTFVSVLGAEGRLASEHLAHASIDYDDIVFLCGYALRHPNNGATIAAWLPSLPRAVPLVIDPGPLLDEIPDDLWRLVVHRASLWTVNRREAGLMLNRLTADLAASHATEVADDTAEPHDGVSTEERVAIEKEDLGENALGSATAPGVDADLRPTAPDDRVAPVDDVAALARALQAQLSVPLVLRDGAEGSWLASADQLIHLPALAVTAVDQTGAGDCHAGVLLAGMAHGLSLEAAIRRANVAAAIAVTRHGGATAPTRREIDQAMAGAPALGGD